MAGRGIRLETRKIYLNQPNWAPVPNPALEDVCLSLVTIENPGLIILARLQSTLGSASLSPFS